MNSTWKNALPVALLGAALVGVVLLLQTYFFRNSVMSELRAQQRQELAQLRLEQQERFETFAEQLSEKLDKNTRALEAALAGGGAGDLFVAEGEKKVIEAETINALAEAIMRRLQPMIPTAEDEERSYTNITERVSTRLNPILSEIARTGTLTRSDIEFYSNQITKMIEEALIAERAEKQRLNTAVVTTSAIAEDSFRLAQEMSALYLSSLKDEGVLSRILSLPVGLVQDVSTLSIVGSSERKEVEERLFKQLSEIENRLKSMRAELPENAVDERRFEVEETPADAAAEATGPEEPAPAETPVRARPTAPADN